MILNEVPWYPTLCWSKYQIQKYYLDKTRGAWFCASPPTPLRRGPCIGKGLDSLSSKYDDYILIGDFNSTLSNTFVGNICGFVKSLKSLIKKPSCFRIPDKPTCIDMTLSNRQKCFKILPLQKQVYLTSASLLLLF